MGVIDLNFSSPAVSHICNLTYTGTTPYGATSITLDVNYAPIVDSVPVENVFSVYLLTILVLPTDLSPIITILKVIIFIFFLSSDVDYIL